MFPSLIHFKEGNNMNKLLETNLLIINGYPLKVYHVLSSLLGAVVAWILMASIFAIF